MKDEVYRRESLRRAYVIYRSIFSPEDDVIFIHRTYYRIDEKRFSKIRLKRFFITSLENLRSCIWPYEFDESDEEFYTKEWSVAVKAKEIRMPYVLECIVNDDFMRKPNSGGRVYLYNQTKGILFHMYDDRGCDIFSANKDTLLPFYHLHRKWILDYNRYQIDHLLDEGLAGINETDDERKVRSELNDKKVIDSRINFGQNNTCHIMHHFEVPFVNADKFEKEISFTSFVIRRSSIMNDMVTFSAAKTEALALIDYQTHLMSMYGKKYGTYIGWSYERLDQNKE
ncbi:DUF3885 domain-containing protein [Paenibacillus lupini]|uniref:DUF3885 domain-containing protein n=1 Tax=Paenibacillus lupini TaxID=1450204 RepID=UPI001422823C|nr:DUF3885 domain-containing protein [Paenibacillus lupini]NIK21357.1 hypothetical protein [Paenibacillus lupini]